MATTTPAPAPARLPGRRRQVWTFCCHFLEMLGAMMVGMAVLYPVWLLYGGGRDRAEVELVVMASTMALPMAAWMLFRGHQLLPVAEMTAAMYAGFVVLFPLLWLGVLDEIGVMAVGHVLMVVFMLGAMLARRQEYAGHPGHPGHAGQTVRAASTAPSA